MPPPLYSLRPAARIFCLSSSEVPKIALVHCSFVAPTLAPCVPESSRSLVKNRLFLVRDTCSHLFQVRSMHGSNKWFALACREGLLPCTLAAAADRRTAGRPLSQFDTCHTLFYVMIESESNHTLFYSLSQVSNSCRSSTPGIVIQSYTVSQPQHTAVEEPTSRPHTPTRVLCGLHGEGQGRK